MDSSISHVQAKQTTSAAYDAGCTDPIVSIISGVMDGLHQQVCMHSYSAHRAYVLMSLDRQTTKAKLVIGMLKETAIRMGKMFAMDPMS